MALKKQVKYWRARFKVLDNWKIEINEDSKYKGQSVFNKDKKEATIYGWPGGKDVPSDYALHELLHVAFVAVGCSRKKIDREDQEDLIRDICKLLK